MPDPVRIDGSLGEGGGQIVRTSVALSSVTGHPVEIHSIRAARRQPGLQRQHLTAVKAIAEITRGSLDGADLGSRVLRFRPGQSVAGDYHFDIGSAGSATLVVHTILWPLLAASGRSRVVIEGGTHNPMAPPYEHLESSFLPVLRSMGAAVEVQLERHGFFPAGGGRLVLEVKGPCSLTPLNLIDGGSLLSKEATALVANLPGAVAVRELKVVRDRLGWADSECHPRSLADVRGPGNVLLLQLRHQAVTEVVTGFGEKGVRAERVAERATRSLARYIEVGAPVGEQLADQLIVPMALAGGGIVRTLEPTPHTRTNLDVVGRFIQLSVDEQESGSSTTLQLRTADAA